MNRNFKRTAYIWNRNVFCHNGQEAFFIIINVKYSCAAQYIYIFWKLFECFFFSEFFDE